MSVHQPCTLHCFPCLACMVASCRHHSSILCSTALPTVPFNQGLDCCQHTSREICWLHYNTTPSPPTFSMASVTLPAKLLAILATLALMLLRRSGRFSTDT